MKYPDQYLHVKHCSSGEEWIIPFDGNAPLDLKDNLTKWIALQFCGELELDGDLMPKLEGEYYAQILTDNRPPASAVVWQSGGFYLKSTVS